MKAINLDYARQPPQNYMILGWLLIVTSLILAFYLIQSYLDLTRQVKELQNEAAQTTNYVSDMRGETVSEEGLKEVEENNRILRKLGLPWNELFEAIESIPNDHVAILSISPDPEQRVVVITAEAKEVSDISKFIQGLEKTAALEDVHLVSHQVRTKDAYKPTLFTIEAHWIFAIKSSS